MKDRRLAFGAILALFAGLSFWWLAGQDEDVVDTTAVAQLPDSYFTALRIVSHDASGKPVSRLQAARATHYPDDPLVYLEQLRSRGLDTHDNWILEAGSGQYNPDNDILHASGDVRLQRQGTTPDDIPVILNTDQLTFDPQKNLATTESRVTITQGKSSVQGIGLFADLGNDYIEIPARVEARYEE